MEQAKLKNSHNHYIRQLYLFKNHRKELHDIAFINIKTKNIQLLVDNSSGGYTIKKYIKTLFNQLYDFTSAIDIPCKNYTKYVELENMNNQHCIKI